jgi:quinol monooxygenase YgiN
MLTLAASSSGAMAGAAMLIAGLAWIGMLTSLNVAAQFASASWVKARALAVYLLVFQGSMTGGSVMWGTIASHSDVTTALVIAAIGQLLALALAFVFRLPVSGGVDLAPSRHWAEPVVSVPDRDDRGPVLIEIEYRVAPDRIGAFVTALRRFEPVRHRDGAIRWDVWEDMGDPGRVVETFVVESWLEHQRQHDRVTHADRITQESLNAFHIGDAPPLVRHLLRPIRSDSQ